VFKKIYIRVMKGKGRNKQFLWCLSDLAYQRMMAWSRDGATARMEKRSNKMSFVTTVIIPPNAQTHPPSSLMGGPFAGFNRCILATRLCCMM
jgi:hypothetical protein